MNFTLVKICDLLLEAKKLALEISEFVDAYVFVLIDDNDKYRVEIWPNTPYVVGEEFEEYIVDEADIQFIACMGMAA